MSSIPLETSVLAGQHASDVTVPLGFEIYASPGEELAGDWVAVKEGRSAIASGGVPLGP